MRHYRNYKAIQSLGHLWRRLKSSTREWREKARLYCEKGPLVFKTLHKGQVKYIEVKLVREEAHFGVVQQSQSLPNTRQRKRLIATCEEHMIVLL